MTQTETTRGSTEVLVLRRKAENSVKNYMNVKIGDFDKNLNFYVQGCDIAKLTILAKFVILGHKVVILCQICEIVKVYILQKVITKNKMCDYKVALV